MAVLRRPSPNWNERPPGTAVDTLILHYTGMRSAQEALDRLCDEAAQVSAHYLIDEDGAVVALVPEDRRAWHAGRSAWLGGTGLNDRSIGIELVNPGHEFGYRAFPEAQIDACLDLGLALVRRWPIPARRVLAHSDVAPDRKLDPGELFPWRRLAEAGLGLWPAPVAPEKAAAEPPAIAALQAGLAAYGYAVPRHGRLDRATTKVIAAFQRHFRPERVDGVADAETAARLRGLLARLGGDDGGGLGGPGARD